MNTKGIKGILQNYIEQLNQISIGFITESNFKKFNFIISSISQILKETEYIAQLTIITSIQFQQNSYKKHLKSIISELENLYQFLEEESEKSIIIWDIIHPSIKKLCKPKYDDGHFADSVETAMKELNMLVKGIYKSKTGNEKDGKDLMLTTFSRNNPTITIGDVSTETGLNLQEGYMHLFAGGIQAFRNPNAHENRFISSEVAIHQLSFASLLMYILDNSSY